MGPESGNMPAAWQYQRPLCARHLREHLSILGKSRGTQQTLGRDQRIASRSERRACTYSAFMTQAHASSGIPTPRLSYLSQESAPQSRAHANSSHFGCGHERRISKGQWDPLFSADVHRPALGHRSSRQERRSNPTRPAGSKFIPPGLKLVIETHAAAPPVRALALATSLV